MGDRIQSIWQSYVTDNVAANDAPLESPSLPILNALLAQINQLPPPLPCQHAVQDGLIQAIQLWQAEPEIANNSLVVLGRPVEDVAKIIKTSLQSWPTEESFPINITFQLGGYQRPLDPLDINTHVREAFPLKKSTAKTTNTDATKVDEQATEKDIPTLVVVPHLEQLFLRCIQGWEGIEYLQNLTTRDTSRFWVFGCNHWAWAFLDRVCQVSAYLEQPLQLPQLTGEDLQRWLTPLFSKPLVLTESDSPISDAPIQLEMASDTVWQSLSNASSGIGATAARVWLSSLRIADESSVQKQLPNTSIPDTSASDISNPDTPNPDISASSQPITPLVMDKAALPSLISLNGMDRYILYALLIHGDMTRAHLALSLGEAERKIRSRLQVLRREGIILQRGRRVSLNPAHYPKLYSELKNNNYLVGEI